MTGPAARIRNLYRRHAGAWITARGTVLLERGWIERFVDMLRRRAGVLDIGRGSGDPIARHLAGGGHPVTGVDGSPEMMMIVDSRERVPLLERFRSPFTVWKAA